MPGLRRFQANSAAKPQYDCLLLNQAGLADICHFWGGVPCTVQCTWCLLVSFITPSQYQMLPLIKDQYQKASLNSLIQHPSWYYLLAPSGALVVIMG